MNDICASVSSPAAWPAKSVLPLASPRGFIAAWRERIRFRWELRRMAEANPHLIADIGLGRRELEAEIAKPFWQG